MAPTPAPLTWPVLWRSLAESSIEDGEWEDTLTHWLGYPLQGYAAHSFVVRICLAVALRPAEAVTAHESPRQTDVDTLQTSSATPIRMQALSLLESFGVSHPKYFLECLPGYPSATAYELSGDSKDAHQVERVQERSRMKSALEAADLTFNDSERGSQHAIVQRLADLIKDSGTVWRMLSEAWRSTNEDEEDDDQMKVEFYDWDLLGVVIKAIERESFKSEKGWSPGLLRQFRYEKRGPRARGGIEDALHLCIAPFRDLKKGLIHEQQLAGRLMYQIGLLQANLSPTFIIELIASLRDLSPEGVYRWLECLSDSPFKENVMRNYFQRFAAGAKPTTLCDCLRSSAREGGKIGPSDAAEHWETVKLAYLALLLRCRGSTRFPVLMNDSSTHRDPLWTFSDPAQLHRCLLYSRKPSARSPSAALRQIWDIQDELMSTAASAPDHL